MQRARHRGRTATPRRRPARPGRLDDLRLEAAECRRCDLWKRATQTVFGSGPARARVMLVGEQPGDVEDRAGEPFVGPAGRLLREALEEAGLPAATVYMTNAVKHFKWEPRGKRRIHKKPNGAEMEACRFWLDGEIAALRPTVIVALGATAARSLLGPGISVTRDRGQPLPSPLAPIVTVTVHPSSILRTPDAAARAEARAAFVDDLRRTARLLASRHR